MKYLIVSKACVNTVTPSHLPALKLGTSPSDLIGDAKPRALKREST